MLERILVPTDGSPLSERAFPIAQTLARAQGAEVMLARAVLPDVEPAAEVIGVVTQASYDELVRAATQEANGPLTRAAAQLRAAGVAVRTEVLHGAAATALLDYERKLQPDLVVMATHGRTGLARLALGSIAETILRQGSAPVLFIRPFAPALSRIETALVPLDGSALAEEALPLAELLAGKPLRSVRLMRAIAALDERQEATTYLEEVAARLAQNGIDTRIVVEKENAARAIEQAAADVDLVILSTHGRGGWDRLRHGSVADRVMHHVDTPTLLVRAGTRSPIPPSVARGKVVAGK